MFRQVDDSFRNGVANCRCAMSSECWPILDARVAGVTRHPRQVQEEREPRLALHQRADGGTAKPNNQISLPMTGNRTVGLYAAE